MADRGIVCRADSVLPLPTPFEYYKALCDLARTATRRISIVTFYSTLNGLEQHLFRLIAQRVCDVPALRANFIMDMQRGMSKAGAATKDPFAPRDIPDAPPAAVEELQREISAAVASDGGKGKRQYHSAAHLLLDVLRACGSRASDLETGNGRVTASLLLLPATRKSLALRLMPHSQLRLNVGEARFVTVSAALACQRVCLRNYPRRDLRNDSPAAARQVLRVRRLRGRHRRSELSTHAPALLAMSLVVGHNLRTRMPLLLSSAMQNWSTAYFTRRQDRYMLLHRVPELAASLHDFVVSTAALPGCYRLLPSGHVAMNDLAGQPRLCLRSGWRADMRAWAGAVNTALGGPFTRLGAVGAAHLPGREPAGTLAVAADESTIIVPPDSTAAPPAGGSVHFDSTTLPPVQQPLPAPDVSFHARFTHLYTLLLEASTRSAMPVYPCDSGGGSSQLVPAGVPVPPFVPTDLAEGYALLLPRFQLGSGGIQHDTHRMTQLLRSVGQQPPGTSAQAVAAQPLAISRQSVVQAASAHIATGYFNLAEPFQEAIIGDGNAPSDSRNSGRATGGSGAPAPMAPEALFELLVASPDTMDFAEACTSFNVAVKSAYTDLVRDFYTRAARAGTAPTVRDAASAAVSGSAAPQGQLHRHVRCHEFVRRDWTFHAKGLWLERQEVVLAAEPPGQQATQDGAAAVQELAGAAPPPALADQTVGIAAHERASAAPALGPSAPRTTMIASVGSSNFGARSESRDLEWQVEIQTADSALVQRLQAERAALYAPHLAVRAQAIATLRRLNIETLARLNGADAASTPSGSMPAAAGVQLLVDATGVEATPTVVQSRSIGPAEPAGATWEGDDRRLRWTSAARGKWIHAAVKVCGSVL